MDRRGFLDSMLMGLAYRGVSGPTCEPRPSRADVPRGGHQMFLGERLVRIVNGVDGLVARATTNDNGVEPGVTLEFVRRDHATRRFRIVSVPGADLRLGLSVTGVVPFSVRVLNEVALLVRVMLHKGADVEIWSGDAVGFDGELSGKYVALRTLAR